MIVGIDIGGTTTKIVSTDEDEEIFYTMVKASDPVAPQRARSAST